MKIIWWALGNSWYITQQGTYYLPIDNSQIITTILASVCHIIFQKSGLVLYCSATCTGRLEQNQDSLNLHQKRAKVISSRPFAITAWMHWPHSHNILESIQFEPWGIDVGVFGESDNVFVEREQVGISAIKVYTCHFFLFWAIPSFHCSHLVSQNIKSN